jgi:hypothetical protein
MGEHPTKTESQRRALLQSIPVLACNLVEQFFNKIKQCRRVATTVIHERPTTIAMQTDADWTVERTKRRSIVRDRGGAPAEMMIGMCAPSRGADLAPLPVEHGPLCALTEAASDVTRMFWIATATGPT